MAKTRNPIKHLAKIKAELQKEINSKCPFCFSDDVGHFQIHHIDEDPSNNVKTNFLLVCPTCHSKITKKEISHRQVSEVKKNLASPLEFGSITIDSELCSWKPYDDVQNAFCSIEKPTSPFPIFCITIINHSGRSVVLNRISLLAKHLYSGLSGIAEPRIIKSLITIRMHLPHSDKESIHQLVDEIIIPNDDAAKLKIEVVESWEDEYYTISGRKFLRFTFHFNANQKLTSPNIFLNCQSENDPLWIQLS